MKTLDIGSRRELFVDDFLVATLSGGAERRLNHPTPREMVLKPTNPWERLLGYITVFRDGDRFRMYYKTDSLKNLGVDEKNKYGSDDCVVGHAESDDGIHWEKPSLGLIEFNGTKDNNIVWKGRGSHGFAPFKDPRPDCPPEERYKAVGRSRLDFPDAPPNERHWRGLYALVSPDGLAWAVKKGPKEHGAILNRDDGYFDSQNLAFWHDREECYRVYLRKKSEAPGMMNMVNRDDGDGGIDKVPLVRDIATATSKDFIHWSTPEFLSYPGAPTEELYTNMIIPYPRASHIMVGFPARYMENRGFLTDNQARMGREQPGRYFASYTDGLFMSSRDGETFHRWPEAFLRPGMPEEHRWGYGECYLNWGIVETANVDVPGAPNELSFYAGEGGRMSGGDHETINAGIRRHTLRVDGFVSVNAPLSGGELTTKPLTFAGDALTLNVATSAAGGVRVEIRDENGAPYEGFALDDCEVLFGNGLDKQVKWSGGDLTQIAEKPVTLRFVLSDADLYSFQFSGKNAS